MGVPAVPAVLGNGGRVSPFLVGHFIDVKSSDVTSRRGMSGRIIYSIDLQLYFFGHLVRLNGYGHSISHLLFSMIERLSASREIQCPVFAICEISPRCFREDQYRVDILIEYESLHFTLSAEAIDVDSAICAALLNGYDTVFYLQSGNALLVDEEC